MTSSLLVDTDDIGEAEAALTDIFGPISIGEVPDGVPTRTRLWRTNVGVLSIDQADYGYDMTFTMEPPQHILLARLRSGTIEEHRPGLEPGTFGPGRVAAFGAVEGEPIGGVVHGALYDLLCIDRDVLADVAGTRRPDDGPVRLTSTEPVSLAANQLVVDAIDYVRHRVLTNAHAGREPLVTGALSRYLASTVLSAFPHAASGGRVLSRRRDDTEVLVRRAVAFIDDHADTDISPADIAAAAHVSPDALQMMFVRHQNMTPTEYLRRARLHHARLDLVAGDPDTTTVAEIARRWGFARLSRFALAYRLTYGESPKSTLRGPSARGEG